MSLIEGVGDEVAVFGIILLVLILAATFTFVLNNNPVSERSFTPSANVATSHQNHENHQAEPQETQIDNLRNRDSESHDASSPDTTSSAPQETAESESENIPNSDCHNTTSPSSTDETHHCPEVPDDIISGEVNEEANVENDDSPSEPGLSRIRLKYLNDTERSVSSLLTTTVREFIRTHFAEDLANNKVVRLIYAGQRLQDHVTLQSYGIAENCVIHVQVIEAQVPNASMSSQNAELDLSHLLWPLLSVILGICWILYFKYPEFFNLMSLGILLLFTGSFVYFYSQIQLQG